MRVTVVKYMLTVLLVSLVISVGYILIILPFSYIEEVIECNNYIGTGYTTFLIVNIVGIIGVVVKVVGTYLDNIDKNTRGD